ncbi:procathepsin L-like [Saccostrea echinata]|uniref:procathepsin L-like n=1 Tax=Saccostrea echinata TaxID=191078 RepID=UPI002A814F19|nr:procathepsin L-like [Saccostrea echinata]
MVIKFLLLVVFLVCTCYGSLSDVFLDKEWEDFKRVYGKIYSQQEENRRKLIWRQNLDVINKHNIKADLGHHSYRLGMNKYGDMTSEEVSATLNGARGFSLVNGSTFLPPNNLKIPDTVDWRSKGYVTPVKDQGNCGSCWAFSATGGLEGQHFRKTGKLVSLSEQNLLDCSKENMGCRGGLPSKAYQYIKNNGGIDTEESYPYQGTDKNTCRYRPSEVGATCTGFVQVSPGNELNLQKAVASVGPITVCIDASKQTFHLYKEGVYDDDTCSSLIFDHAVLVVGYGVYQGKDYWLVKNSWNKSWGMDGYIMMSRNKDNQCGIANHAVYPTV